MRLGRVPGNHRMKTRRAEARYAQSPREHDRVAHLVLGQPLPPPPVARKPDGMSRQQWKLMKATATEELQAASAMDDDLAHAVQLRASWRGVAGTPETLERAARSTQGALARLYRSGAIDANQLAAAEEIRAVVERIRSAVALPIASWETRVDAGFRPDAAHQERYGHVLGELSYTRWRAQLLGPPSMAIEMIVDDVGYSVAAVTYRMSARRARALLIDALELWWRIRGHVGRLMRDGLPDVPIL